jgi:23S rRNA (pseudouridine1915-N3)-methyltransferase
VALIGPALVWLCPLGRIRQRVDRCTRFLSAICDLLSVISFEPKARMMTWKVIAVGKPKLQFAAEGIQEYLARIRRFAPCESLFLNSAKPEKLAARILKESEQSFRVVLDERGEQRSSEELAEFISEHQVRATRRISLIVGGAEGQVEEIRLQANWLWALSRLTLQHELALMLALEQVYRAYSILNRAPYHRA